ncbi:MAG: leucyl/phenylalanyl-tRNA--protein transferase [Planctomycetes bacterium]|nr:leucyl/phenylalanyl-tRNA--protein transferase [Planctomycetota bacterium]
MSEVESLKNKVLDTIHAYLQGLFPMAEDGILGYYSCDPRSVFFFDRFHIPSRLKRIAKQNKVSFSINRDFERVIRLCREGRDEWISEELVQIYLALHEQGMAHSVEVWQGSELVGGLYGTQFGAAFLAESMFHRQTHASNLGLLYLMERLEQGAFHFCDIQYANSHTERFNPVSVPRESFHEMYYKAIKSEAILRE